MASFVTVKVLTVKLLINVQFTTSILLLMMFIVNAGALTASRNIPKAFILDVTEETYDHPTKYNFKNRNEKIIDQAPPFPRQLMTDIYKVTIRMQNIKKFQRNLHRNVQLHHWKRKNQSRVSPFRLANKYYNFISHKHKFNNSFSINTEKSQVKIKDMLETIRRPLASNYSDTRLQGTHHVHPFNWEPGFNKLQSINDNQTQFSTSTRSITDLHALNGNTRDNGFGAWFRTTRKPYPWETTKWVYPWERTIDPWRPTLGPRRRTSDSSSMILVAIVIFVIIVTLGLLYKCCSQYCCNDCYEGSTNRTLHLPPEASTRPSSSSEVTAFNRSQASQSTRPVTQSSFANRMRNALGRNVEMTSVRMTNERDGSSTFNISSTLGNTGYGSSGDSLHNNYDQYYERLTEFQNPLTLGDEIQELPAIHGGSSISNRQSSTSNARDSRVTIPTSYPNSRAYDEGGIGPDRPPNYAEVAFSDLGASRSHKTFDRVIPEPVECPPPSYDAVLDNNDENINPSAPPKD